MTAPTGGAAPDERRWDRLRRRARRAGRRRAAQRAPGRVAARTRGAGGGDGRRGRAGAAVLFGAPALGVRFGGGFAPAFGVDRLSGFFLVLLALIAVAAAVYARDALRDVAHPRVVAGLSGVFCLALVGLVAARDVATFLGFWELMTSAGERDPGRAPGRAGAP